MPLGQQFGRRHIGNRRPDLVLQARHDIALAAYHGVEAGLRDVPWIVLVFRSSLCILHAGAVEERRFGSSRHQARHSQLRVAQLLPESKGERVQERFGVIIDGPEAAWREPCDIEPVIRMRPALRRRISLPTLWMR